MSNSRAKARTLQVIDGPYLFVVINNLVSLGIRELFAENIYFMTSPLTNFFEVFVLFFPYFSLFCVLLACMPHDSQVNSNNGLLFLNSPPF